MANNDADLLKALRALPTATRTRQLGQSQRVPVQPTSRTNGPSLAERLKSAGALGAGYSEVGIAQRKLTDYTNKKASEYPTLAERLGRAQGGDTPSTNAFGSIGGAILDNPITKGVLGAISVVDTGLRGVVSTVREGMDILDTDPATKASFGDWFDQTKDTDFHFGTAFPMKGNWGRAIGFLGDVGLDPLTYATFGSSVPVKAAMKATRLGEKVVLRAELGVKNIAGREGRVALAGLAERMGASDELVKAIAARGKSAFRQGPEGAQLAEKMGLQKNGIYYLGSRIRVPLSGPLADFIETGLAKARIGFLEHVPGASKLQEMITPAGIHKNLAKTRAGLSRGAFPAADARQRVKSEAIEFTQRSRKKVAEGIFSMKVTKLVEDPDVQNVGPDFYQFLDRPQSYTDAEGNTVQLWNRQMTPAEVVAKEKYRLFWKELADEVDIAIKVTEPTFEMNRFEDFLPHIMSDEAAKMMENRLSLRAEQIQSHLKFNIADPKGSFRSRTLAEGDSWFGHTLTDEDIRRGVDRLNYLASNPADKLEAMKGNFFETDMFKILSKYGEHYSSQIGMAGMFEEAFKQGIMRQMKTAVKLNGDWTSAIRKEVGRTRGQVKVKEATLRKKVKAAVVAVQKELEKSTKKGGRPGPLQKTLGELKTVASDVGSVESATTRLQKVIGDLKLAREEHRLAVQAFDDLFEEKNVLVQQIFDQVARGDAEMERMIGLIDNVSDSIFRTADNAGDTIIDYEGRSLTVDEALTTLNKRAEKLAKTMNEQQAQSEFIDQVAEEAQLIMGQQLSNAGSTGNRTIDRMLALSDDPASRAKGVPGSKRTSSGHGGLTENFIRHAMRPDSQYPELKTVLQQINPGNSKALTPRKLSQIFLDDYTDKDGNLVRGVLSRIANGVTTGTNHEELRQAAAWLIIRDYKYARVTGSNFADELALDAATQTRHANLVEMLKQADIADTIDNQRALNVRNASKAGTVDKPVSATQVTRQSEMQRTVKYVEQSETLNNAQTELSALQDNLDRAKAEFESLPEPNLDNPQEVAAFRQAQEQFASDQRRVAQAIKNVDEMVVLKEKAATKLPITHRKVADQLGQTNGAVTRTAELATATAEYFLHREATIQTSRIAGLLQLIGYRPTPELYRHMVGRIADDQLGRVTKFQSQYRDAVGALTRLRDGVVAPTENSQGLPLQLKEKLRTLFDVQTEANPQLARDRELIREFFPELESVWRSKLDSPVEAMFNSHPDSRQLLDDLVAQAKRLGIKPEYTRTVTRPGGIVHFPKGALDNISADGTPYRAAKGTVAHSKSQAAQAAEFESGRINVRKLMSEVLKREDERVSGKGATGAQVIKSRFTSKTATEGSGSLTTSLSEVFPDGFDMRPADIMARQRSEEVRHLHSRFRAIMDDIDKDKALARKANKSAKAVVGPETKGLTGPGEHYGLVAVVDQALRLGDRQVNDLFSELLGGPRTVYNPEFTTQSIVRGKLIQKTRSTRMFKEIPGYDSLTGRALRRTQSHIDAYRTISTDPLVSAEALLAGTPGRLENGQWIPGTWAFNPDLQGASGLANALDEEAIRLTRLAETADNISVGQGRIAAKRTALDKELKAPMSYSNYEIGNAERLNRARALQIAKKKMEPAIARLKKLQAHPLYARALKHQAEQEFANELAGLSTEFVINSGMFTPLEWRALWDSGVVNIGEFEPGMQGVKQMLGNQMDIMVKERNTLVRQGRSTKVVDSQIEKILQAQSGSYNLDEFKALAHAKFAQVYAELGSDDGALSSLKKIVADSLDAETGLPTNASHGSPYELRTNIEPREAMLRARFEGSPEAKHLMSIARQQEEISQGMIDHMLREPVQARRLKLGERYASDPATAKQAPGAIQHVARAPASEFPQSGPDIPAWIDKRHFQSKGAASIYSHARELRREADIQRLLRIADLEEQLGRGDARQLAHSAEVQRSVKRIDKMLQEAGVRLDPNARPIDVAATAERTAGKLRTEASAYEGIDLRTRRALTRKVIDDLGYEPGQSAQLDKAFEKRLSEEIKAFRKDLPAPRKLFEVDEARRAEMAAKQSIELAPIRQELQGLQNDIMRFKLVKVLSGTNREMLQEELAGLTASQRALLRQQLDLGEQLSKATDKAIPASATSKIANRQSRLLRAEEALQRAGVAYDVAADFDTWGPAQIQQVELHIAQVDELMKRGRDVKRTVLSPKNTDWQSEADEYINDARGMLRAISGSDTSMTDATKRVLADYMGARKEHLMATHEMSVADQDAIVNKLIRGLDPTELQQYVARAGLADIGMVDTVRLVDEGFVQLSKYFPNIQVRKEVAEIYQNVHRVADPAFARELQKHLGKYTQFFKAYATLSPGFHLRNAMSNTFMAVASGANLVRLARGLKYSHSMLDELKKGGSFETWIAKLPATEQAMMRATLEATAASGGGLIDDFLSEITPLGTKHMKKVGRWIEQHSRFMLAYDGVAGGFTPQQAAARVKRFLIDYQDVSTLDATMRQIVPFWMWTSRNLPLQVTNMWLNPRAYQIYNAIKRNLRDDEEGDIVPQWMTEMGAFKLPFGNDLYATPDIGFNRVQQQINELADPSKFMANVNPMLRVPLELMGGKQFFSGREFSPNPIPVSGGISPVLQPLLEALGYGTTGPDGTKFVDDKAYYAIRNLIPFLGASERLVPTAQTGKAGSMNPLLGFLGVPARQNTLQMQLGEIARRKRNVSRIASREKSMQDAMGG